MENDLPKCSKETIHETESAKTSELESHTQIENKPLNVVHQDFAIPVDEIEVIDSSGPSNIINEDCSGPSICMDGEIICELNDVNKEIQNDIEFIENKRSDVQCEVDIGK